MNKLEVVLIIIPVISLIALPLITYFGIIEMETIWNNLTYFLLAGIFLPIGTLVTLRLTKFHNSSDENNKTNKEKRKHKEEIVEAIKIISEGHYGEDDYGNTQFLIPYPYDEYVKDQRKEKFPTISEKNEEVDAMFNRSNPYKTEEKKYEFVPLDKSNDAKFDWAWEHLQSYNDIKEKIEVLKKIYLENKEINKNNEEEVFKIMNKMITLKKVDSPLYEKWQKHITELNNSQQEMKEEMSILFHKLDRDESMKGKCKFCR